VETRTRRMNPTIVESGLVSRVVESTIVRLPWETAI